MGSNITPITGHKPLWIEDAVLRYRSYLLTCWISS